MVCYPRRWDSVSFYLGREVACFAAGERDRLIARLLNRETLLFVKNGPAFAEVIRAMPQDLQFVPCGRQGGSVSVGMVKRRPPSSGRQPP